MFERLVSSTVQIKSDLNRVMTRLLRPSKTRKRHHYSIIKVGAENRQKLNSKIIRFLAIYTCMLCDSSIASLWASTKCTVAFAHAGWATRWALPRFLVFVFDLDDECKIIGNKAFLAATSLARCIGASERNAQTSGHKPSSPILLESRRYLCLHSITEDF